MTNDGNSENAGKIPSKIYHLCVSKLRAWNAVSRNLKIFPLLSLGNSFLKKISQTKYPTKLFICLMVYSRNRSVFLLHFSSLTSLVIFVIKRVNDGRKSAI